MSLGPGLPRLRYRRVRRLPLKVAATLSDLSQDIGYLFKSVSPTNSLGGTRRASSGWRVCQKKVRAMGDCQ